MGKKNSKNNKQEPKFNAFKVANGRAKKAKQNRGNVMFNKQKFNVKNRDDVDKLDAQLDSMQSQVRAKHNQERSKQTPIEAIQLPKNDTNINMEETITNFSNL